jgi:hypothetical protein
VQITVTTPNGTSNGVPYIYFALPTPPVPTGIVPTSGPQLGGTPFTINGTNLLGTSLVTFNGIPATGLTVNPLGTQILGTTPASLVTGNVPVAVTTLSGTALVPGGFTYV